MEVAMSKKGAVSENKLLISQQEMVLIKNSSEAKNFEIYGNLYDCLENYSKLSKRELEQNIVFDQKARIILLSVENRKTMLSNILNEWYSVKECEISDAKLNCQLCGHANKYIFFIHNKITDIDLHIGSECVKKFPDITGIQQERKRLSQMQKENERQKRKIEFEVMEDDLDFLMNAKNIVENIKIMLPYKLNCEINDTLYQLNLIKTSYIKSGGCLEEVFEKYKYLKAKFMKLNTEAEDRYQQIKNSILICDKETADWILSNYETVWEYVAKNDGLFDVESLKKIYFDKFVIRLLPEFKKHLKDSDIQILYGRGNLIFFSIKNNRYVYPVTFSVTMKKFMETIGCYCITDLSYHFGKTDLQDIFIENSKSNFDSLYNSVTSILRSFGYDFIIEDKTMQGYWKKLPYKEKGNKWSRQTTYVSAIYKKSDIALFLNVLSPFLLKEERVLKDNFSAIIKKMENGKVWITQSEKDFSEQIAKEARGLQKQKEFTRY
jgi:hypothetical protein